MISFEGDSAQEIKLLFSLSIRICPLPNNHIRKVLCSLPNIALLENIFLVAHPRIPPACSKHNNETNITCSYQTTSTNVVNQYFWISQIRSYESYLDAVACLSPFCNPPLLPPAGDTATLVLFDDDPPTLLQLGAKASAACAATFTFGPPSASLKAAARVKNLELDCRVVLCLFVSCIVVAVLVPSVKTQNEECWIWKFMKKRVE